MSYTLFVSAKKALIGFGIPRNRCDASRSSPADHAASLFVPPFLVARMGGRKAHRFAQAVPGIPTRSSHRPRLESGAVVFANRTAWSPHMDKHTTTPNEAACRSLFGEHAEDVISPIKCAADALGWIEEILKTIQCEALKERNGHRIKQLAEAAAYLASDMSNYAIVRHETMIHRLRTAGVITFKE
jgi:hypothetical protein